MSTEVGTKRAALLNILARYASLGIQLVYTAILSRLLTPEDFGVVAIAQVFVTFFSTFSDMGVGSAVIQRRDLTPSDIRSLFAFSLLVALGLGVLFALAGVPIAFVYSEARLKGVCAALSVSLVFSTINTMPNALIMKEKRFVRIGVRQVACSLVSSAVCIALAMMGLGLYAITVYSGFYALLLFAWNYSDRLITPDFNLARMRRSVTKIFGYSAYLLGFDVVNYFSRNLDNLLVGYFFGTAMLGNYSKAYQLMRLPQSYLTSVVTPVLHPMLADRQDDRAYIYGVFLKSVKMLSLLGVFITVFCFFCADDIVSLIYGPQWGEAAVCFRLLAVSVWSQMVCGTSSTMFQVLNKTREQFARGVAIAVVIVSSILLGVALGSLEAVAMLVGVAYYIAFVTFLSFLIRKSFGMRVADFLRELLPDLLIAVVLSLYYALVGGVQLPLVGRFVFEVVSGGLLFLVLLALFGQLRWFDSLIPGRLRGALAPLMRRSWKVGK